MSFIFLQEAKYYQDVVAVVDCITEPLPMIQVAKTIDQSQVVHGVLQFVHQVPDKMRVEHLPSH